MFPPYDRGCEEIFWSLPQKVVESLKLTGTSALLPKMQYHPSAPEHYVPWGFFRGTLSDILDHLTDAVDLLRFQADVGRMREIVAQRITTSLVLSDDSMLCSLNDLELLQLIEELGTELRCYEQDERTKGVCCCRIPVSFSASCKTNREPGCFADVGRTRELILWNFGSA
jgi:hypothetical protein